jgi:type I restriction enzyme S subunit
VQDAKEKTGAVIATAKSLKKSLMRHLFTYGPVSIGAAESVPLTETEIGPVPEGWIIINVGEVGKVVTGTTPRTSVPEYYGGAYMFTSPGDIGEEMYVKKAEKYISEKGLKVSRPLPRDTVLVVCIGATIGKTALTSAEQSTTNQQINAIIPNEKVFAHYLYYAISHRAPYLPSLAGRAAVPIVNKSNFANFPIPLPPLTIQQKIASILSTVDKKIEAEENKKKALDELFKSLLRNLMTGKIRVNHMEMPQ